MQIRQAAELRRTWGKKPCFHPAFDKEYDLGGQTGDYICTTCGETFMMSEYENLIEERKKADNSDAAQSP